VLIATDVASRGLGKLLKLNFKIFSLRTNV